MSKRRSPEDDVGEAERGPYAIVARWGDELLDGGFTVIPNLVMTHYAKLGITPAEMMLVAHIVQYQWTEQNPYPGLPGVAERMGLSRRQVNNYVKSLKDKGFLTVHERTAPGRGQITSEYDFSGLRAAVLTLVQVGEKTPLKNSSRGGLKYISRAPLKRISTEEYEGEEDPAEKDENIVSNATRADSLHKIGDPVRRTTLRQQTVENSANADSARLPDPLPPPQGFASIGHVLGQRQPLRTAPAGKNDTPGRGRPPKAPPYIEAVMADVSGKLHDEHPRSSLTRATRLWKASGLSEQAFVQRLYEAQSITRQQGNVNKRATNGYGTINRMPYFFAVLEDVLGMKGEGSDGHDNQASTRPRDHHA